MKAKLLLVVMVFCFGFSSFSLADEGMWLPLLLDKMKYDDLQKQGLNLSPEDIYSVNKSSLKDAIVLMGDDASGSLVSADGLILGSHNFAFKYLQENSTVDNDLITDGFWAKNRKEELPNKNISVSFLKKIEDVTDQIFPKITDYMTEPERNKIIREISEKIEKKAKGKSHYDAKVIGFGQGSKFFLFVYETFPDVRLVGAPPVSIGRFGGDQDNWNWPRHTGDFSFFRVYTDPDGKPAEYSEENIPYKSEYYLSLSINGIQENDFTLIMGYPMKTNRFLSSTAVELLQHETNPIVMDLREKKLDIWNASMKKDPNIRINYASKYADASNYWKYVIGLNRQLERFNILDQKKELEEQFQNWVIKDIHREHKYGLVLKDIKQAYAEIEKYNKYQQYYEEVVVNGTDLISFAHQLYPLYLELEAIGKRRKAKKSYEVSELLKKDVREIILKNDFDMDKKVFIELFGKFYNDLPKEQLPEIFKKIQLEYSGRVDYFANAIYSNSFIPVPDDLWYFLNNPDPVVLENDYAFKLMHECLKKNEEFNTKLKDAKDRLNRANRLLMEGLKEMLPEKENYYDANSSLRISFGNVKGYNPMDGLISKYYTTCEGILEKENPSDYEFFVNKKLKQLIDNKDYGKYGVKKKMNICFTTTNDATGGNSGSPVLNGDGQIVGLVFDSNWEGMSGDYQYQPDLQRAINVDIRYVLFIIDKYAGASNIIEEMNIVKK